MKKVDTEKLLRVYIISSAVAIVVLLIGAIYMGVTLHQVKRNLAAVNQNTDADFQALSNQFNDFCVNQTQDANQCN